MEQIKTLFSNVSGWFAGGAIYLSDHWSAIAAGVLFVMQVVINIRTMQKLNKGGRRWQ